jgi:Undecaprenyl-phosphate glucose phosphotransferase
MSNTAWEFVPPSRGEYKGALVCLLIFWDTAAVFLSGYLYAITYEYIVMSPTTAPEASTEFLAMALRTSALGSLLSLLVLRQAPTRQLWSDMTAMFNRTTLQVIVLLGLLLAIGYSTRTFVYLPRAWVVAWASTIFVSILGGRMLLLQKVGTASRRLIPERVAVVGERTAADLVVAHLRDVYGQGIEIVGRFLDEAEAEPSQTGVADPNISCLIEIGKRYPLDRVVLALPGAGKKRIDRLVDQLKALNVDIAQWLGKSDTESPKSSLKHLRDVQIITIAARPISQWGLALKTLIDQILTTLLVLILLPLVAIIAIAIRVDSPGPILFRQRRHGLNNTEFEILKFRTMTWRGYSAESDVLQTRRNDPRVTRVGRFLRRSSLDELPQLLNILRGEMSLVGPRPHPIVMRTGNRLGEQIVANYPHRHRVKPGVTGWAQVNGLRGATSTEEQIRRRIEHDLLYIENWSIFFDLKILALTPIKVVLDNERAF